MTLTNPARPHRRWGLTIPPLAFFSGMLLLAGCQSQQIASSSQPADWTAHPQPQYIQGRGWYLGQSGYGPVYYGPEGHYEIYGPPPPAFPLPAAPTSPKLNPPPH